MNIPTFPAGTPATPGAPITNRDPLLKELSVPPRRLLSIVCQGRNDNYMGNFSWRIATVLNNHARNLMQLGAEGEVEIIVADWGSYTPFWKTLELSPEARRITKFMIVPPPIAESYDRDAGFAAPHPTNAIVRRCWGKYILFADSDIFITLDSMTKLLYHLRQGYLHDYSLNDCFFWASKYHIPYDLVMRSPYIEEIDAHLERHWHEYTTERVDKKNFLGCGVALLMKRDIWFDTRGWDERLIYWGWNDIDWHRRLVSRYRWDDLELHGMKMFHLEHYAKRFTEYTKENPRKANPQIPPTEYAPNPPNWGLADHTLAIVDGYGLAVDPATGETPAKDVPTVIDAKTAPQSVSEIIRTVPIYRDVAARFEFNPSSWFCNGKQLDFVLAQLKPKTVVEIGSWMGASARHFAACPFVEKLYCVDHWDRKRVENYVPGGMPEPLMNNMYEQFLANCVHANCADKIYPLRNDSVGGARYCLERGLKFDLIYIDGEHSTLGVRRDILAWLPLLAPNGFLCGDDWSWQTEPDNVAGAVMGVAQELDWEVFADNNFWFVVPRQPAQRTATAQHGEQPRPNPINSAPMNREAMISPPINTAPARPSPIKQTTQIVTADPPRPLPAMPAAAPATSRAAVAAPVTAAVTAPAARAPSELDQIIPPEVTNDAFYAAIRRLAQQERLTTILEIGSSSGGGSTEALVSGIRANPHRPTLFCMEVSRPRYSELKKRYENESSVRCYNVSSIPVEYFPAEDDVARFYQTTRTNLNDYPLERVLGWLRQDIEYVSGEGVPQHGIEIIKTENGIRNFDMVLIDGSEFTGIAELEEVYGAKLILLDDTNTFKNFHNRQRLMQDPSYELVEENPTVRNGYAIFRRREQALPT